MGRNGVLVPAMGEGGWKGCAGGSRRMGVETHVRGVEEGGAGTRDVCWCQKWVLVSQNGPGGSKRGAGACNG